MAVAETMADLVAEPERFRTRFLVCRRPPTGGSESKRSGDVGAANNPSVSARRRSRHVVEILVGVDVGFPH
jgi:hypothetical protein